MKINFNCAGAINFENILYIVNGSMGQKKSRICDNVRAKSRICDNVRAKWKILHDGRFLFYPWTWFHDYNIIIFNLATSGTKTHTSGSRFEIHKGTVSVISNDPSCKYTNGIQWYPWNLYLINNVHVFVFLGFKVIIFDNSYTFFAVESTTFVLYIISFL